MLLRNYYSSLTFSAIGNTNITEDVATDLSPRYSRSLSGDYSLADFPAYINDLSSPIDFYYGTSQISKVRCIWFGSGTAEPTFNDYAPTSSVGAYSITSTRTSYASTYDDNTKTYTSVELYTLTNNTSNALEINELLYGGTGRAKSNGSFNYPIAIIRILLGENSFTLEAGESVKFELTVKYTIAQPLQ